MMMMVIMMTMIMRRLYYDGMMVLLNFAFIITAVLYIAPLQGSLRRSYMYIRQRQPIDSGWLE